MIEIQSYGQDGAKPTAQAVLAYLKEAIGAGIEGSWNKEWKKYDAEVGVAVWYNGREQGYIVSMMNARRNDQINIAFYEHRNSDQIVAVMWNQLSMNPLTVNTMKSGVFESKNDYQFSVEWNEAAVMAEWIFSRLVEFWETQNDG